MPNSRLYHPTHYIVEELKPSVKWTFSGVGSEREEMGRGGEREKSTSPGLEVRACRARYASSAGGRRPGHPSLFGLSA